MRMYRLLFLAFLFLAGKPAMAQQMTVTGNVFDTVSNSAVENAVAIAVRIKDSVLVAHARTNRQGSFELKMPVDTVEVIISERRFSDQRYYLFGSAINNVFNFGKVILPPKSKQLEEVVIYAYKDPIYYNGDTLIYTADSFKVKANAVVEELLKKLPGIKVDAQGNITSQGKKVDQVLVDGDEFFGSDHTVATRNLNATSLESVQVYEKKNENASEGDGNETIKVMDLKLKDDAKKGYFGKIAAAGDGKDYYEGEFLANKFKNKQKISVFGLLSNTPRSGFGWRDMYRYGINNDMGGDNDGYYYSGNNPTASGIPHTFKSGFYYTDKLSSKTKLTLNYSYSSTDIESGTDRSNQYFLSDTSYKTLEIQQTDQRNENHSFNFSIDHDLDSLTEIKIKSNIKYKPSSQESQHITNFLTSEDYRTHQTNVENNTKSESYDWSNRIKLERKFKKKDRELEIRYDYDLTDVYSKGTLISRNDYFVVSPLVNDNIQQLKDNSKRNDFHSASASFVEPLSLKTKLEFSYDYTLSNGLQNKQSLDYVNGEYSFVNPLFSNRFKTERSTNRAGIKFTYDVKKQRLAVGARVRRVFANNVNRDTKMLVSQQVDNILPYITYRYRFSENRGFGAEYMTSSDQPALSQLQPVPDNSNPNQVFIGNPDLLPTFSQIINLRYNSYKPISGSYVWGDFRMDKTDNAFSNSIEYDEFGRTIRKTVNVDGNYNGSFLLSSGIPLFSKLLILEPGVNYSFFSNTNFINGLKNRTTENSYEGSLGITVEHEPFEFIVNGSYLYKVPHSTINKINNTAYSEKQFSTTFKLDLPAKFRVETNAELNIYDKRSPGYNIDYLIWNASLSKTLLKRENLIISVNATDILNQNISTSREVRDNVITDTKTNIVGRYIMLKAVYKFNSSKQKEENDEHGF